MKMQTQNAPSFNVLLLVDLLHSTAGDFRLDGLGALFAGRSSFMGQLQIYDGAPEKHLMTAAASRLSLPSVGPGTKF